MRKFSLLIYAISFLVSTSAGLAYEVATHEDMSEVAAFSSVLANPETLSTLGLTGGVDDQKLVFPNADGTAKTIRFLIRDGANFEDNLLLGTILRVRHHFYDPLYDRPLTVLGVAIGEKSPDWALEDLEDFGSQVFSFRHARDYLYKALTLFDEQERKKNFGLTFQTLGHVIHHLQDMAQPQHTRNDIHPSIGAHKSLYEEYTEGKGGNLPFGGYTPLYTAASSIIFGTPRKLWRTSPEGQADISQGKGIAEFTNRNFVSAATNFDKEEGQAGYFPSPKLDPNNKEAVDIKTLIPGTALEGMVTFYGNPVYDAFRNETKPNPRASSESLFDEDLKKAGRKPVFTLNSFNFDEAHKFLIPRAVAYSAGLIDYFFRGRLEAEDVIFTDTGISLRVKNAIDPAKVPAWQNEVLYAKNSNGSAGSFTVAFDYQDSTGKTQYGVSNTVPVRATDTLAPGQVSADVYDFTLTIPSEAKDVNYRLVFRGKLGQEEDAVAVGPVEPVSGFVFSLNYFPADDISGPRAIFRQGGSWRLSQEAGLQAGNIDWKGWYVNGKPTKVLTWKGPPSRSFANHYVPARNLFSAAIYQDGELWAQAPGDVLGAAITRDASGKEWLVAVCRDNNSDVVYRRPNTQDNSPALFDPVIAPDGWHQVARFEHDPVIYDRADVPWFFNGSGTEAQTMRKGSKDQGPSVGTVSWLYRLHLVLSNGAQSARLTRDDNLPGITDSDAATLVCNSAGKFLTRTSESTGQFILAVDYLDNTPLYAIFSVKRSGLTTDSQDAAGNHGKSEFSTEEKVTFPDGKDLVLYSNTTTSSTTAVDHSEIDRQLLYLDLRYGFHAEYTKIIEEHGVGDFTTPTTWTIGSSQSVVFSGETQQVNENTPITFSSVFRYFPSGFTHPGVECNNSVSSINISTRFQGAPFLNLKGSWAVDSNRKLFFSEPKLGNDPSTHSGYYNYLSDGNLKQLIPPAPFNAFYYDIGVIH